MKKGLVLATLLAAMSVSAPINGMDYIKNNTFMVAAYKRVSGFTSSLWSIVSTPFIWFGKKLGLISSGPQQTPPAQQPPAPSAVVEQPIQEEEMVENQAPQPAQEPLVAPAQSPNSNVSRNHGKKEESNVAEPVASSSHETETPGNPALENNEALGQQIRASRNTGQEVHVLPSLEELKNVKVCPPFAELFVEPVYYTLSSGSLESGYAQSQSRDVNDVRCSISSSYSGYELEFYQLRTINQSMKVDDEQIFTDTCGALALFAAEIMSRYAHSGDVGILRSLYDVPQARLKAEQCYYPKSGQLSPRSRELQGKELELKKERLYSEQVQTLVEISPDFQSEGERAHIAILESPQNIVGGGIEASSVWGFNRDPMRTALAQGLKQDSFYYNWIMGNEDEVELGQRGGHWYCVTLLKVGKKLQFIVIDSLSHYHLQPNSYDYNRLTTFAKTIMDTWLK